MDLRKPLEEHMVLKLDREYRICRELARGGNCIVYDAVYTDGIGEEKTVRIKECYPYGSCLKREETGALSAGTESEASMLKKAKERMIRGYRRGNELFQEKELTNLVANTADLFFRGNTVYIVTAYTQGKTLYRLWKEGSLEGRISRCAALVKMTAAAIEKIHQKGYLYLDCKLENILVLHASVAVIQLFDFDSLVPFDPGTGCSLGEQEEWYGTRGFAAPEQRLGRKGSIGRCSDIYGIGALLFYLLFGKTPEAADREADAEYEYASLKGGEKIWQERLFFQLTDFFHHTLAGNIRNRWSDMKPVVRALEALEKTADMEEPRLVRTRLIQRKRIYGRRPEYDFLDQWFGREAGTCLVVTGMGGIGKSTLIRQYLADRDSRFDQIIFMNFRGTMEETLEKEILIRGFEKNRKESRKEYLERKLAMLHRLVAGSRTVFVMDEFVWKDGETLTWLLNIAWKLILITREQHLFPEFDTLPVGKISDKKERMALFCSYLGRGITAEEETVIEKLSEAADGHTLLLELMAKQIRSSHLTPEEALICMQQQGIFELGSEQVAMSRDFVFRQGTIREMVNRVFDAAVLSEETRRLLMALSLFGIHGIRRQLFLELIRKNSRKALRKLETGGWITAEKQRLQMHPVLIEMAAGWQMSPGELQSFRELLNRMEERLKGGTDKAESLEAAGALLEGCRKRDGLLKEAAYRQLLYRSILCLPRDREEERMERAEEWRQLTRQNSGEYSRQYDGRMRKQEEQQYLDICEIILETLWEQRRFREAHRLLREEDTILGKSKDPSVRAQWSYFWVGYYDAKLNGGYDAWTPKERRIRTALLDALEQSIRFIKKVRTGEEERLGEYLRCKALVLIRSGAADPCIVRKLLREVKKILGKTGDCSLRLKRDTLMTCAWYYTYVEEQPQKAAALLKKSYQISRDITVNTLDLVDEILVPAANICLECGGKEEAVQWLELAIRTCSRYPEILAYRRKKEELEWYLSWCNK